MTNKSGAIDVGLTPLNARSIVLSVLLGSHPPRMRVGRLLAFTALFGIADGTVRTALSRMVAHGDLSLDDGVYELSERLRIRQAEQDTGRAAAPNTWDGTWWMVVVTAERRPMAQRREFRSRAVGARLGELRPDTWIRPANIAVPIEIADVVVTRGELVQGDGVALVEQLWDLDTLDRRAAVLLDDLDAANTRLTSGDAEPRRVLPDVFTTLAATQRFLRTEPQLPIALSDRRNARILRDRDREVLARFQSALATFFTTPSPPRIERSSAAPISTGGTSAGDGTGPCAGRSGPSVRADR